MIEHPRTAIRAAVVARLQAGIAGAVAPPAGTRVWAARAVPVRQFPHLLVYDDSEGAGKELWPGCWERKLKLSVAAGARSASPEELEKTLDRMAMAIELIILNDPHLGLETVRGVDYSCAAKERSAEGPSFVGYVEVNFNLTYQVPPAAEALVELEHMRVRIDLAPADGQPETDDTIILE